MNKIAPLAKDIFYVNQKFLEKDSFNSLASEGNKSNVSMNSSGFQSIGSNNQMSIDSIKN